MYVFRVGIVV